jgi:hypothetical protein
MYVTRQITSRRLGSSEFIPLALTVTQFTVTPLLSSAVAQLLPLIPFTPANARLQLTGYSLSSNSLLLNSVRCSLFRLGTDNIENTLLLGNRYQVLSGVSTYALPSNRRPTVAWRHSLAGRDVYRALRNDGRSGSMWRHSREHRFHVTLTSCCAIHVTILLSI